MHKTPSILVVIHSILLSTTDLQLAIVVIVCFPLQILGRFITAEVKRGSTFSIRNTTDQYSNSQE